MLGRAKALSSGCKVLRKWSTSAASSRVMIFSCSFLYWLVVYCVVLQPTKIQVEQLSLVVIPFISFYLCFYLKSSPLLWPLYLPANSDRYRKASAFLRNWINYISLYICKVLVICFTYHFVIFRSFFRRLQPPKMTRPLQRHFDTPPSTSPRWGRARRKGHQHQPDKMLKIWGIYGEDDGNMNQHMGFSLVDFLR